MGLLLPILTYGADLLVPNHRTTLSMNSFWHRVCRSVTNSFYSTPTSILTPEACLLPIDVYCRHWRRMAALRIACAPPSHNPAAARLPSSFPSLSSFRALDSLRHLTKGLSSYYLPMNWHTLVPSPPMRKTPSNRRTCPPYNPTERRPLPHPLGVEDTTPARRQHPDRKSVV